MKLNFVTYIILGLALAVIGLTVAITLTANKNAKLKERLEYEQYYNGTLRDSLTTANAENRIYQWEIQKIDSVIKHRENNVQEAIDSITGIADSLLFSEWSIRYLQLSDITTGN